MSVLTNARCEWIDGQFNSKWRIVDQNSNELLTLEGNNDERSAMAVLRFAREHAGESYKEGFKAGFKSVNGDLSPKLNEALNVIERLRMENERLAGLLEKEIAKGAN